MVYPGVGVAASGVSGAEVWLDGTLIGGAIGIGIGCIISGDSLFGRHQGAARVAVADMAAGLDLPRERYLPLPGRPAERIELPSRPLPARRLLGPAQAGAGRPA